MPRKSRPLPPVDLLKSMFALNEHGRLINKINRTSRIAGAFADVQIRAGCRTVYADGRFIFAHRVVWTIFHGEEPPENIDHINGDPLDNRPENLRAATHAQNMFNKKIYRSNTSGAKGLHRRKDNGLWRAYISAGGKRTNLGQFATAEEAQRVLDAARQKMHGAFARST